jgi:hypothetical protein
LNVVRFLHLHDDFDGVQAHEFSFRRFAGRRQVRVRVSGYVRAS